MHLQSSTYNRVRLAGAWVLHTLITHAGSTLIYTKLVSFMCSPTEELGRTEVVRDNLHPEWAAQIVVTYIFEVQQTLIVKVRHNVRPISNLLQPM